MLPISLLGITNTMRRHLYMMRLIDSPLRWRSRAEQETSALVFSECEALASLKHTYWVPFFFFFDPADVRISSLGQSGTLVKEQGSQNMASRLWGTEGLTKRPRCIGSERAGTHLPFRFILSFSRNLKFSSL
jgi:hypothetical protein